MFLYVVEDSNITRLYLQDICKTLLKRRANRVRVPIEFKAVESDSKYPEVRQARDDDPDFQELIAEYYKNNIVGTHILKHFNIKGEDVPLDEGTLRLDRRDLLIEYTRKQFGGICNIQISEINSDDHFGAIFHFLPKNIDTIRQKAKEVGIEVSNQKEQLEKLENTPAEFAEDPPRIIWGDFVIDIPHDTIEHSACRVAFSKNPNELLSWDEVADEQDGSGAKGEGTTQRGVYDAFLRINDRIKNVTKKRLFKTGKMCCFRLY